MTELKTLKDFQKNEIGEHTYLLNSLRAEAVKWVKHLREINNPLEEEEFMEFFNLIEEDLK